MERARSALFPRVHSKFEWGDVFWVKVHYGELVQTFPLWIPAKTKGTRTKLRLPAFGKHALRWRKWQAGQNFSFVDSSENQRNQELVNASGYWKTCFMFEKMAEKQPKSSEREVHLFSQFIVSLSGAMSFGSKCTMANLFKFFLC